MRVIPNTVKIALEKTLSDFRSRNVLISIPSVSPASPTRVANTATTPAQEGVAEVKDGRWMLQKPLIARASAADLAALLERCSPCA